MAGHARNGVGLRRLREARRELFEPGGDYFTDPSLGTYRETVGSSGFGCRLSGTSVAHYCRIMTREQVESVIGRVRPFLQADGGDIVVVRVDGNTADVRLTGACAACPSGHMTLHLGVEAALRNAIPEFETLRVV